MYNDQFFIKSFNVADYKFSMYTPSMISAASVAAALHGLGWTAKSMPLPDLLLTLQRILSIEKVRIDNLKSGESIYVFINLCGNELSWENLSQEQIIVLYIMLL